MDSLEFEKKILLVGDGAVGKTSLVRKFVIDKFDDKYIMTIGTKTSRKEMTFEFPEQNKKILIQLAIWDILGQQEGFSRAHEVYFKGAESFIAVFDRTKRESFTNVSQWIETVRRLCGPIPGIIAANKSDLADEFKVEAAEAQTLADATQLSVLNTSAKTGQNVEEAFKEIGAGMAQIILTNYADGKRPTRGDKGDAKKGRFGRK